MSKNQIALKEGRITQSDYDRMAVYKYRAYTNYEDLDASVDYRDHGLYKLTPCVSYTPDATDYPGVVAEIYEHFSELDESTLRDLCEEWDDGAVTVTQHGVWYWVPWGMSGGDFLYLEEILNDEYQYPGKIEVFNAYDAD